MTWRCTYCGREYDADDPPCETCGRETFERVEGDARSTFGAESFVWVCANCGREHVKHPKICSACSHPTLEKRVLDADAYADDLAAPSYLAVGWPYLLGAVLVVGLVALVLTGIVPFPGVGTPTPPDAPGEADTAAGLDLRTVETELRADLAAERGTDRDRDDGLDALVTFLVRHDVATRYDPDYDREFPGAGAFDPGCDGELAGRVVDVDVDPATHDDEAALADALAADLLARPEVRDIVTGPATTEAVAVHVTPDDTVTVAYAAC